MLVHDGLGHQRGRRSRLGYPSRSNLNTALMAAFRLPLGRRVSEPSHRIVQRILPSRFASHQSIRAAKVLLNSDLATSRSVASPRSSNPARSAGPVMVQNHEALLEDCCQRIRAMRPTVSCPLSSACMTTAYSSGPIRMRRRSLARSSVFIVRRATGSEYLPVSSGQVLSAFATRQKIEDEVKYDASLHYLARIQLRFPSSPTNDHVRSTLPGNPRRGRRPSRS
jgi:hypothetical protein